MLPTLNAIPEKDVLKPTMPVRNMLGESESTLVRATTDRAVLIQAGMSPSLIKLLPGAIGALSQCQSDLEARRSDKATAQREFSEAMPEGEELHAQLLHTFHFAYRKNADVLAAVRRIAEGSGHDDTIQDLNDLSTLGSKNPKELKAVKFDLTQLDVAAATCDRLRYLWALVGEESGPSDEIMLRNRAYTYVKGIVGEIREYGQFVFWRDEDRMRAYTSEYRRQYNAKRTAAKAAEEEASQTEAEVVSVSEEASQV
ncbi:hypothetical protein BVY04_04855 [bacterium M21]|nr:hypothetical protein BVY04_04855 [bacterium M21]